MRTSVIIPIYNRPNDLSELLDSLLRQTVEPMEVMVVDDHTPTSVIKDVCKDYEAKFKKMRVALVYVRNPRDRSAGIARNVGAKMAKGDIILFLDSDVVLYQDFVEKILEVFKKYPDALGVGGIPGMFPPFPRKGIRYHTVQTLRKLFLQAHHSEDSCEYPELPVALTKIITCNWLSTTCIAVKRSVINEFQFDEKLKEYSWMEDILFSGSIYKSYPKKLFMTPYAKCIHKVSKVGRTESSKLRYHKRRNRKYVLLKLWGLKGLLMFGWQNFGLLVFRFIQKIRKWEVGVDEPTPILPSEYEGLLRARTDYEEVQKKER